MRSGGRVVATGEQPGQFAEDVARIGFDAGITAAAPPSGITLAADPAHALAFVDWRTPDADGDGTLTTADGALANTALFGLVATPTWTLTLEP